MTAGFGSQVGAFLEQLLDSVEVSWEALLLFKSDVDELEKTLTAHYRFLYVLH